MQWYKFKQDNYSTAEGTGDVCLARYEHALLPPYPSIRVLEATVTVRDPPTPFRNELSEM